MSTTTSGTMSRRVLPYLGLACLLLTACAPSESDAETDRVPDATASPAPSPPPPGNDASPPADPARASAKPPARVPEVSAAWRPVNIPKREHGYNALRSQIIETQKAFDALVAIDPSGWNERDAFVAALKDASIDFGRESLVIIRHTEGSGSNRVEFHPPKLVDDELECDITVTMPEMGTADMAYYAVAYAVDRTMVRAVVLSTQGEPLTRFPLAPAE